MINDSQVPIVFKITSKNREIIKSIEEDGSFDYYEVNPEDGVVEAFSEFPIKVRCFLNCSIYSFIVFQITVPSISPCTVEDSIMVYMWGDEKFYLEIPLKYEFVCPVMECVPSEVQINFCFISFDYTRKIKLINTSDIMGKVSYTPNEVSLTLSSVFTSYIVFHKLKG